MLVIQWSRSDRGQRHPRVFLQVIPGGEPASCRSVRTSRWDISLPFCQVSGITDGFTARCRWLPVDSSLRHDRGARFSIITFQNFSSHLSLPCLPEAVQIAVKCLSCYFHRRYLSTLNLQKTAGNNLSASKRRPSH